eukprot:6649272-Pyramimonas_sp.AAC.1
MRSTLRASCSISTAYKHDIGLHGVDKRQLTQDAIELTACSGAPIPLKAVERVLLCTQLATLWTADASSSPAAGASAPMALPTQLKQSFKVRTR